MEYRDSWMQNFLTGLNYYHLVALVFYSVYIKYKSNHFCNTYIIHFMTKQWIVLYVNKFTYAANIQIKEMNNLFATTKQTHR